MVQLYQIKVSWSFGLVFSLIYFAKTSQLTIDTSSPTPKISVNGIVISNGTIETGSFTGPNKNSWNYSSAVFDDDELVNYLNKSNTSITIKGANGLKLNFSVDVTIATKLDVSGVHVDSIWYEDGMFRLGGFVRKNDSCCTLGAGPGAGYSYHGGGNGGRGGGYYQDRNTSTYYGWDYPSVHSLVGGSTGTALFSPNVGGTGGGAIEIVSSGQIIIEESGKIIADGYSTQNTSNTDCAGASAGGIIRLRAKKVLVNGKLSATGGNSGYSTNTSSFCGGGGGGGVIQIFTLTNSTMADYNANNTVRTRGGRGRDMGEHGIDYAGVFFDGKYNLDVNTTSCRMTWQGKPRQSYQGVFYNRMYNSTTYSVCVIEFDASVYVTKDVHVHLRGKHSLLLASNKGDIDLHSDLTVDNSNGASLGGYDISNKGPQTRCSADRSQQDDFNHLIGGSVCTRTGANGAAFGGGAIELSAIEGRVTVGARITVNASSTDPGVSAMGGMIRLRGKYVNLGSNAQLRAYGAKAGKRSGGIIQIWSEYDVENFCPDKLSTKTDGEANEPLRNIRVSVEKTYQVQYIVEGLLEIETTKGVWTHIPNITNPTIAFSYLGKIEKRSPKYISSSPNKQFEVAVFKWQVPIFFNDSAIITVKGRNSLHLHSKEGMYLGSNFNINSSNISSSSCEEKLVGGFCKCKESEQNGYGPGRASKGSRGGGGHGGKGGGFEEMSDNSKFGWSYGFRADAEPDLLGGSTGSAQGSMGCGGGAIKITSTRSITIGGIIRVSGSPGGHSGGTIVLMADEVNITSEGLLEARGGIANPDKTGAGGGGGGGIIYINSSHHYNAGLLDLSKTFLSGVLGGNGSQPGENGFTIIEGKTEQQFPNTVPEEEEPKTQSKGCVKFVSPISNRSVSLLKHEVLPSICRKKCNDTEYAVIRKESCYCLYTDKGFEFEKRESSCTERCLGNYLYQCGGKEPFIYNAYRTDFTETIEKPTENIASTNDTSEEFQQVKNAIHNATNETVIGVVNNLTALMATEAMKKGDTAVALEVLDVVAWNRDLIPSTRNKIEDLGQGCLTIADRLLDSDLKETYGTQNTGESETKITSPNQVLKSVETIGVNLGSKLPVGEKVVLETKKIGMGIKRLNLTDKAEEETLPDYSDHGLGKRWKSKNQIKIPKQIFTEQLEKGKNTMTVCYVLYEDVNEVLTVNLTTEEYNSKEKWMVNSLVMAVKTSNELPPVLPKPITISLEAKVLNKKRECSFLNFSDSYLGKWSSAGCTTLNGKDNVTDCECNHMTNFAILMQVNDFEVPREHQEALSFITYVGCGISLFALALTLATFLSLETLASERTSIHKNLVIAIGLAQIIFLAGIDAVSNHIACTVVAILLHYFYTAAFTWMLVEGIHLYTKVVEVFSEGSKMKFYYAIGWVLPAIIVLIAASARIEGYGTEMACWISRDYGLIWAFVTPVLVIILVNLVVLVMVIRVILASVTSLQGDGNTSQVKAGIKGMIVLLPLLGITWVFGLLAIDLKTIAFQYIFAILNSLQGLFIFAFHCVGNTEVRIAYKRLHEKRTLAKSLPDHSMSSVAHDYRQGSFKDKKRLQNSRQNSRETNNVTIDDEIVVTKTIRSVSDVKLNDQVQMQTISAGGHTHTCGTINEKTRVGHGKVIKSIESSDSGLSFSKKKPSQRSKRIVDYFCQVL